MSPASSKNKNGLKKGRGGVNKAASKIGAIIQARMGSTRLPGKTLIDICGKPLLQHVIDRVKKSSLIDMLIVATTQDASDNPIVELTAKIGVECFRGSKDDVLDRFYKAASLYNLDVIVRITADDPFKDPQVIDKIISTYLENIRNADYVSNTIEPTYPLGLDIEVFSFKALSCAWRQAKGADEREHVTLNITRHPRIFKILNVENEKGDMSNLRWTIDEPADLEFVRAIYSELYPKNKYFLMDDIVSLLTKKVHLRKLNSFVKQKNFR